MRNILVTGGAGFIGSNFIIYMQKYYNYNIINLDCLTYAGNLDNLREIENHPNYTFIKGDIGDKALVEQIFQQYDIDVVINFAAESHVDRSIEDPAVFLKTNVLGTGVLLEVAKKYWKENPEDKYCRLFKLNKKFIQISTDEVYGTLGAEGMFTEATPLAPNSPYSASKASADLMVRAYYETYGMPMNITRCSNNYGPHQHDEKLIPMIISKCVQDEQIPVYGDGHQVRDWLYVEDHCSAISTVLHKGKSGEVYNIGGNNERQNIEVVQQILQLLGKDERLITYVKDRPGHDRRYAIDNTKITTELGWQPAHSFEQGFKKTIEWYVQV